jgi:hypothetical protein
MINLFKPVKGRVGEQTRSDTFSLREVIASAMTITGGRQRHRLAHTWTGTSLTVISAGIRFPLVKRGSSSGCVAPVRGHRGPIHRS